MKLQARMPSEESANQIGLIGGEVVEDDMNLLSSGYNDTTSSRKAMKSRLARRVAVFPCAADLGWSEMTRRSDGSHS